MKLALSSNIELDAPAQDGYVTWLDVSLVEGSRECGTARIALVHVGEIADAAGEIWPALHGTQLETLHDVYFAQGWYRDEYADGAGIDLLYVDHVRVAPDLANKNLDLAVIRRLCETIGSGCQLAVVGYESAEVAAHFARIGFSISTAGRPSGFMHLNLGQRHADVVDMTGSGDYDVVSPLLSVAPARTTAN